MTVSSVQKYKEIQSAMNEVLSVQQEVAMHGARAAQDLVVLDDVLVALIRRRMTPDMAITAANRIRAIWQAVH